MSRGANWIYRGLVCFLVTLIATRFVRVLYWPHTMDDSYMFVRYADHVIHNHTLSWNVPGKPTYGLTAPAYLLLVVPMRLVFPTSPGAAILASSMVSGVLAITLSCVLLARYSGASRNEQRFVTVFALCALLVGAYPVAFHITSGMDTMLALSAVTVLLILHLQHERQPSLALTLVLGALTGLIFFVRPDLVIYSAGIAAVGLITAPGLDARRRFAVILCMGGAVLMLELLATRLYFGLPLPLPFYAKGMHSYTGRVLAVYRYTSFTEFRTFAERHCLLLVAALAGIPYLLRTKGLRVFSPVEIGVAVSTSVFLTYYLFFVLQILPHEARFYFPTVPALYLVGTRVLVLLLETDAAQVPWFTRLRLVLSNARLRHPQIVGLGSVAFVLVLAVAAVQRVRQVRAAVAGNDVARAFDVNAFYTSTDWDIWYRLDEISRLPDDLVLGTTEVGIPSVLCAKKNILDLAGLNDTDVVKHGFRIEQVLASSDVDVLYLPHPDYTDMNRALLADSSFQHGYEIFTAAQLGSVMGMAIRRNSKYSAQLLAIAAKGQWPRARIHN